MKVSLRGSTMVVDCILSWIDEKAIPDLVPRRSLGPEANARAGLLFAVIPAIIQRVSPCLLAGTEQGRK
jgi:hypothetical protein